MRKTLALTFALALSWPLALADPDVLGVPDPGCQTPAEWRVHDYAVAEGNVLGSPQDGSLGNCPAPTGGTDGDLEWAVGGAYLLAETGDGVTRGSLACWGLAAHHPAFGTVDVVDLASPRVTFFVVTDATHPWLVPAGEPDCGDGIIERCDPGPPGPSDLPQPVGGEVDTVNALLYSLFNTYSGGPCVPGDRWMRCVDSCALPFGPGADGAYHVLVCAGEARLGSSHLGVWLEGCPRVAASDPYVRGGTVGHVRL